MKSTLNLEDLKYIDSQDDIISLVSEETNTDPNLVRLVVRNFWDTIRHYVNSPWKSRAGILIHDFISMEPIKKKFEVAREALSLKESPSKSQLVKLEQFKQVIDYLTSKDYERQASKKD